MSSHVHYSCVIVCCFFFKQKTAYEIEYGLVGSEMCIRDRGRDGEEREPPPAARRRALPRGHAPPPDGAPLVPCLLYTSDAADERSSVDLGGRRIIKKKKTGRLRQPGCHKKTK